MKVYQIYMPLAFLFLFISCKQSTTPTNSKLTHNGVAISYQSCGTGDTTLLFVHGWCINKNYWEEQVKYFCPKYKVITVDLPGFGESGKNRTNWSFDEYTADIKFLIDSLQLKNVVLIGHSMSGDLVLKAGNSYPESLAGLIGIDNLHEPGAPMSEEERKGTDEFFTLMENRYDSMVAASMLVSLFQPNTDSNTVKRVTKDIYNTDPKIASGVLRALVEVAQQEKPLMQGLKHRLYLINSSAQPISPDSLTKYCAKGFEMISLGRTSHYPMIENPLVFNKAVALALKHIGNPTQNK